MAGFEVTTEGIVETESNFDSTALIRDIKIECMFCAFANPLLAEIRTKRAASELAKVLHELIRRVISETRIFDLVKIWCAIRELQG